MQFYLSNIRPKSHHRKWWKLRVTTVPNFLDFTINAVLRPTFIQKLYYKLSNIVTFTFTQIFDQNFVFSIIRMASKLLRLLDTASKFALFSVSGFKDEKFIKK